MPADDPLEAIEELLGPVLMLAEGEQEDALQRACDQRPDLAETLRAAWREVRVAGLMETPVAAPGAGVTARNAPAIEGMEIVALLGSGGMGEVWLAEQRSPVRRRVAVKVIKPGPGMSSERIVKRFASERQALARMSHPCVAQVYGAGTTDGSHGNAPYFLMEYVDGVPITDYCDDHRLGIEKRIELLIQVCDGVQHAHQKGLIHRDLKPSNLLVVEHEGRPTPKIIDFGIAKLTDEEPDQERVHTEFGELVGTPEYMSPEQAGDDPLNLDTRTDVYSLGVVLYQLLSGALPFDSAELRRLALAELMQVVREQIPHKPSTKITELGDGARQVATNRDLSATSLQRRLRGDLDWVTMKALEKDRERRYGSASELAMDLRRYLACDPVLAGPPSRTYRLHRFVQRNRVAVAGVVAVVLALSIGFVAFYLQYRQARSQEALARNQKQQADRRRNEAILQKERADARFRNIIDIAKVLTFDVPEKLHDVEGSNEVRRLILSTAQKYLEILAEEAGHDPRLRLNLAQAYRMLAGLLAAELDHAGALALGEKGYAMYQELWQESADDVDLLLKYHDAATAYGVTLGIGGKPEEASRVLDRVLDEARQQSAAGPTDRRLQGHLSFVLKRRSAALFGMSRLAEAEAGLAEAIAGYETLTARSEALSASQNLEMVETYAFGVSTAQANGRIDLAQARLAKADGHVAKLKLQEPGDRRVRYWEHALSALRGDLGAPAERDAAAEHEKHLRAARDLEESVAANPRDHDKRSLLAASYALLARFPRARGRLEEALQWLQKAAEVMATTDGPLPIFNVQALVLYQQVPLLLARLDDGLAAERARAIEALAARAPNAGATAEPVHFLAHRARHDLGRMRLEQGDIAASITTLSAVFEALQDPVANASQQRPQLVLAAACLTAMGRCRQLLQDHDGARKYFDRTLETLRDAEARDAAWDTTEEDPLCLVVSEVQRYLAEMETDHATARDRLQSANRIAEGMQRAAPNSPLVKLELARILLSMAETQVRAEAPEDALKCAERAATGFTEVAELDPGQQEARLCASLARELLCRILTGLGRFEEAVTHGTRSVESLRELARCKPDLVRVRMHYRNALVSLASASKKHLGEDVARRYFQELMAHVEQTAGRDDLPHCELLELIVHYRSNPAYVRRDHAGDLRAALTLVERAEKRDMLPQQKLILLSSKLGLLAQMGKDGEARALLDETIRWAEEQADPAFQGIAVTMRRERQQILDAAGIKR